MAAEGSVALGRPSPRGVVPALSPVRVSDDAEIESVLRRTAADLSALRLRLAAATRRAEAAAAQARASGPPSGMTLDDEEDELRRRLDQEQADHRRVLEDARAGTEAEAIALVQRARMDAAASLRTASRDLQVALVGDGGTGPEPGLEPPLAGPGAPTDPTSGSSVTADDGALGSVPVEPSGPSFVERVFRRDLGLSVVEVAIVVLLALLLVAVVR